MTVQDSAVDAPSVVFKCAGCTGNTYSKLRELARRHRRRSKKEQKKKNRCGFYVKRVLPHGSLPSCSNAFIYMIIHP